MKTACFYTYKSGPGRVSIARWEPRGTKAGYRRCSALAPRRDMLRMSYRDYRSIYMGVLLGALDPERVVDDLAKLSGDHEPVLLCWERPPLTAENWCHRTMVAEWLGEKLGLDIKEHEKRDDAGLDFFEDRPLSER